MIKWPDKQNVRFYVFTSFIKIQKTWLFTFFWVVAHVFSNTEYADWMSQNNYVKVVHGDAHIPSCLCVLTVMLYQGVFRYRTNWSHPISSNLNRTGFNSVQMRWDDEWWERFFLVKKRCQNDTELTTGLCGSRRSDFQACPYVRQSTPVTPMLSVTSDRFVRSAEQMQPVT